MWAQSAWPIASHGMAEQRRTMMMLMMDELPETSMPLGKSACLVYFYGLGCLGFEISEND